VSSSSLRRIFSQQLFALNRARCWRRSVRIEGALHTAPTLDRLVYLWKYRLFQSGGREQSFLRSRLRPGMRVVDIGANLGVYAHVFARAVGPTGEVIAFEPDPTLHAELAAAARRNGLPQLRAEPFAVGAAAGRDTLAPGLLNSGDNRLSTGEREGAAPAGLVHTPIVSLDDHLQGRAVDFIKMDVQGWEVHALRGMTRTLAANPSLELYIELWPYGLRQSGTSAEELLALLADQGFQVTLQGQADGAKPPDLAALAQSEWWFTDLHAWRPRPAGP
jgi:FkbM family methyltransferase